MRTPTPLDELTRWQAVWRQLPLLGGLVVLWVFLWDHVDVLTITTGIVLAIAVTRTLYLPPCCSAAASIRGAGSCSGSG
ncbi:hypothetical protein [Agromyces flavus]|uniref:hypothetical protein n=1 Tax=Agromyces flavus TaxID=589382 RepID=UPI00361E6381